jgi:hypothetical protein
LWLLSPSLAAKTKPAPQVDPDYIAALAAANRFLHAWQTQDQETGLLMLTDAAKRATTETRLVAFFAPGSGVEQGYEISHGRKLKAGRYIFPVVLLVRGSDHKPKRPRLSQIIVIRTSKDDWAVDKLP